MNSVDITAANAGGNAVHSTTRSKMSQVWLASQTGVMARSMRSRGRRPRLGVPGEQVPQAAAEVGAAEDRVGGDPDPERRRGTTSVEAHARGRRVGHPWSTSSPARHRRASARSNTMVPANRAA